MVHQSQREAVIFRSSIKSELLNRTLRKGGFMAVSGALVLLLGGTILPLELLKFWGVPIFLVGITLIAIGLLPYRRLTRLQTKPHEIHYDGETILFCRQGAPLFKITDSSVDRIEYREKAHLYGIAIWLKRPLQEKVKVLQPHFNFATFSIHSAEHFQSCDLFLPYFSERSFTEFLEIRGQPV